MSLCSAQKEAILAYFPASRAPERPRRREVSSARISCALDQRSGGGASLTEKLIDVTIPEKVASIA